MKDKSKKRKIIISVLIFVIALIILGWCLFNGIYEIKEVNGNSQININIVSLSQISTLLIGIFMISGLGFLFGKIKVKGISFGTAGVFLVAILFGYLFTLPFLREIPVLNSFYIENVDSTMNYYYSKVIANIGLVFFVSSIGFGAGPKFFNNLKTKGKKLIILVLSITLTSGILAFLFGLIPSIGPLFSVGLLAGANTTTPGFASAIEAAESIGASTELVKLGYAVAYPFGVINIVLFIQVLPKLLKVDVKKEAKNIHIESTSNEIENTKLYKIDRLGLSSIAISIFLGILLGSIKIPVTFKGYDGYCFSLGNTGGILFVSILMGHIKKVGKLSVEVDEKSINVLRELGLVFFLLGTGVAGGVSLVSEINKNGRMIIVYGILAALALSILPLVIGFIISRKVLKLNTVESLGSITGGRTSTPALGMLIETTGSSDVSSLYTSTYPMALVLVVLIPQIILSILL